MSSNNIIYGLPSEELIGPAVAASGVTVTSGALDTGYTLGLLCNGHPGKGCRFVDDFVTLLIDHGSAVTCQFPQLTHTNLRSGASAHLQRNATNSWGSPSVNVGFTLTDADRSGLRKNPWLNRSTDAVTYRYSRLVISGNGVPVVLGQLPWYSTLHQLTQNIPDQPVLLPKTSTDILTTGYNAELIAQRAVLQWSLSTPASPFQTGTSWQEVLDWVMDAAGPAQAFGMVFDPSKNDAWFARFASDTVAQFSRRGPAGGVKGAQLGWIEKSRGQVWG